MTDPGSTTLAVLDSGHWGAVGMTKEMRTLVWNEKFFADMRQRYFGRLAARYRRVDSMIHIVLLVLSGATVSSASEVLLPPQHTPTLALIAFVLAAAATVMRLSHRSSSFAEFSVDWGRLHNEYAMLWTDLSSSSAESVAVRQQVQELRNRAELIALRSTPYGTRRRLLLACHREAAKAIGT